ncbi:MAG: ANTAR domain-containing protein [Clostridia bacterium]|nr:ANTAR domain-containing protein [Clostridia bacterium]
MDSALILSSTEKSTELLRQLLSAASCRQIHTLSACSEARRLLSERDFDLVVINAPLGDETGERLARDVAGRGMAQVILLVKSEFYEEVAAAAEDDGVLTVAKPLNKTVFWAALKLAGAAQKRLRVMGQENRALKQKLEDIRSSDRAKSLLISCLGMTEQEAHRYIEKQAMDQRLTKRAIAEGIIKTYEN